MPSGMKASLKAFLGIPDMELGLLRLSRLGFRPTAVLDIGANVGAWSRMCRRAFPGTRILAIEPQDNLQAALRKTANELGNVTIAQTLLGARSAAAVPFHVYAYSGMSSVFPDAESKPIATTSHDMVTLDELIARTDFPPAQLIKLDVQGYELEVLRGGSSALETAEVVLSEVSMLPLYEGGPIMHEVVGFMADAGFHAYDFLSERRRPSDDALFQTDMLFVRHDSPIIASKHWK
jgi:FkbM family methyltransferase